MESSGIVLDNGRFRVIGLMARSLVFKTVSFPPSVDLVGLTFFLVFTFTSSWPLVHKGVKEVPDVNYNWY